MKKAFFIFLFLGSTLLYSQTDFSSKWEDFYSYNNVKDFVKTDENIFALTDNALFIYNEISLDTIKVSSVNGLSGNETSSIYYSNAFNKIIIGYKNGLIEIIDENNNITIANDIANYNLFTEKAITNIEEFEDKLYIATPFAIVVYDLLESEFGDTYFIGPGSTSTKINNVKIFNENIYAATEQGIFSADIRNPNLIDYNNWKLMYAGNFIALNVFSDNLFSAQNNTLYQLINTDFQPIQNFTNTIISLKSSVNYLTVSSKNDTSIFDTSLNLVNTIYSDNFNINTSLAETEGIYIATDNRGILKSTDLFTINYEEIHPDGPTSNNVFSIEVKYDNLWVVYGGYDAAYTPLSKRFGFSHFNGEAWVNTPFSNLFPASDLVNITLDPIHENKAFLSSWHRGMLVVEDDVITNHWTHENSGLESLVISDPTYKSVRINGSAFDSNGNLWIANAWIDKRLKKYSSSGAWSEYDLSPIITNTALGLNELVIDKQNTIWLGSRRNGVLVYNENGDKKRALTTEPTKGSLPDLNARTLAIDKNGKIWIGTQKGLVVYNNASGVFDATIYDANPVIILDDGIAKKLLGDQTINTIAIDGANNKWFGTDSGGVIKTNPSGSETLHLFNKDNSPLPSNRILKIKVEDSSGKVFFATDKGIVAFNSNVAPFGSSLEEVYAYPNPAKKNHETITIDGRNGTHLPEGTNVKILDTAGNLVFETNVVEGQELNGGKVVWNKTNLSGTKVASGIYIVLLSANDNTETTITKIAIIN